MKNLEIHRLTPERMPDFFGFFDNRAFEDNPAWAGCYCVFYHHEGSERDWLKRTGDENRQRAAQLIRQGVLSGFLAYRDGEPVGWCNANEKKRYCLSINRADAASPEDDDIISIVCFVVYHRNRGEGISTALLDHVLAGFRGSGKKYCEAYPLNPGVEGVHYHGPLQLYLGRGFSVHRRLKDYSVVRLDLNSARA